MGAVPPFCGDCPAPQSERPIARPPAPVQLPAASRCPSAVVPYLQGRGIDPEIIRICLESGILYESRRYQNCVFVGRDPSGHPRSAALRGTRDSFKLDTEGSDKRYAFCLPASDPACPRLAVAESPIDALSLATLEERTGGPWQNCYYLSLSGTAPNAPLQFLRDHPAVSQISLCLDNDKAGLVGMDRLEQAIRADPALAAQVTLLCRNPPPAEYGKDYNEFLTALVRMERGAQHGREAAR